MKRGRFSGKIFEFRDVEPATVSPREAMIIIHDTNGDTVAGSHLRNATSDTPLSIPPPPP